MENSKQAYPYIWEWVKEQGTISIGFEDYCGFLRADDPGGTCWESDEKYSSFEAALNALEAGITEHCKERGLFAELSATGNFKRKIAIDSSMLDAIRYNPETQILEAWFNSGKCWEYHDVPENVFEELLESDSKGGYMRDCIIGCYPENQVKSKRHRR